MMDLTKMTIVQLVAAVADHDETADRVIWELARRLEKAEGKITVLNDEADAGRALDAAILARDAAYGSGVDSEAIDRAWDDVRNAKLALKEAMAATDAARGGAE